MNSHTLNVQARAAWHRGLLSPMGVLALAVLAGAAYWLLANRDAVALLLGWLPALFDGFRVNIGIGLVSVLFATLLGALLGAMQVSPRAALARPARAFTLFFRNAPWLVVIFFMMYLIPFEVRLFGEYRQVPDWIKVALGLSLTASGYAAEVVRGGIQSIPLAQWEAAATLGLDRRQVLRKVILPQALRSMLPALDEPVLHGDHGHRPGQPAGHRRPDDHHAIAPGRRVATRAAIARLPVRVPGVLLLHLPDFPLLKSPGT
ncbi:MAG: ABC transporter permease subunit [Candidatus Pseudomonas colombiensis]|nr:MAG: ABC transporter permease subunit [Pseudomonas sp.]